MSAGKARGAGGPCGTASIDAVGVFAGLVQIALYDLLVFVVGEPIAILRGREVVHAGLAPAERDLAPVGKVLRIDDAVYIAVARAWRVRGQHVVELGAQVFADGLEFG